MTPYKAVTTVWFYPRSLGYSVSNFLPSRLCKAWASFHEVGFKLNQTFPQVLYHIAWTDFKSKVLWVLVSMFMF